MNEQYKDATGNYLVGQLLADAMTHDVKKWSAAYVADHSWRADLRGADLRGANLDGADLSWNSHDLIAEILRRAAGDDIGRRKLAGLVLVSRDWCWAEYATRLTDDEQRWCIEALEDWLVADWENAPAVLRRRARQLGVCDGAAEETEAA